MASRICFLFALWSGVLWAGTKGGSLDGLAQQISDKARPFLDAQDDLAVAVAGGGPKMGRELCDLLVPRLVGRTVCAEVTVETAAAQGFERVLAVRLDVVDGKLRAEGNLWQLPTFLWGEHAAQKRSFVFAEVVLDAELKSFQAERKDLLRSRRWQIGRLGEVSGTVLALEIADGDGDGRADLLAATAEEVFVLAIRNDAVEVKTRIPMGQKPASRRPRSDVVVLRALPSGFVGRSSRFSDGVQRSGKALAGFPFVGVNDTCTPELGTDQFWGKSCGLSGLDRFFQVATRHELVVATQVPTGFWFRNASGVHTVDKVGAPLALLSEGEDAVALTTAASLPGSPDILSLRSLSANGPSTVLRTFDFSSGITALGAGDVDGDGHADGVVAVRSQAGSEIWWLK